MQSQRRMLKDVTDYHSDRLAHFHKARVVGMDVIHRVVVYFRVGKEGRAVDEVHILVAQIACFEVGTHYYVAALEGVFAVHVGVVIGTRDHDVRDGGILFADGLVNGEMRGFKMLGVGRVVDSSQKSVLKVRKKVSLLTTRLKLKLIL